MNQRFRDREHYLRAGLILVAVPALFLGLRGALVPDGFGAFGHYRPGALDDNRDRPKQFAGSALCEECHGDVVEVRLGSAHAMVRCEACHGPLAAHAEDPSAIRPVRPDPADLCLGCHQRDPARPAAFPQVEPEEHAGSEPCVACHRPHHPEPE